ncbi:hypothetical protein ACFCZR_24975 [Streptomyces rubiginosohelvolus]|uniref:hypothetical protein n=1 Tax=Streptomyces rubiginosohelvolus TaxID=67362 RepID=UPI0035DA6E9A
MASTKTTYSTTHPATGEPVTFTKGGRPVRWITWGDLGNGFVHFGFSSQEEYKKAVRAPRSSNPYATRYEATAATVVEDKPAEQIQQEADPTPVAEEAPAPTVTPDEVAEALDRIAVAHARLAPDGQAEYLPEVLVHLLTYGLPYEADDDAFGACRAELRRSGRLPHVEALVAKVRTALRAYVGESYNRVGVTIAQIRHAARTVRLAARYPAGEVAVRLPEGDEKRRDVVVVLDKPDLAGKVQVHSVAANGQVRVPLTELRPGPELPPEPEGKITDWWTITDANGTELTRVKAENDPAARKAARRNPKVVAAARRDNGFAVRRLRSSELATPVGTLNGVGRIAQPAAPARTVTVTTGFTRKSIPTRLRESGAPGGMVNSAAAGGALRWRLPDGEELTPGEAAKRFLSS